MRKYESYKDSGVEWIGKIPSQWKTMPLKRYGHFNKGLTFTKAELVDEGNAVVSYGQVHSKQNNGTTLSEELIRYIPDSIANNDNSIVRQGDFIFADTSEDLNGSGNVVYIDRDEKIYGGYHTVLFQTPNSDNKYLAYLFTTDCWRSQIRSRVSGVKVFSITQSILGLSSIILPPVKEQQAMVAYLDEKTSRIDRIIKSREEKIKLLEELRAAIISNAVTKGVRGNVSMGDSGIDWIGRIPKHWIKCRFKNIATLITEPSISPKKIGLEQIESKTGRFIDMRVDYDGNGIAFKKNDIIYGKLRPYLQKVWLATFDGNAVGDFFVYRCLDNCLPEYLHFYMLSDGFTSSCNGATNGAKMPRVPSNFISSMRFFLPTKEEQKEIIDYLDNRLGSITNSICNAQEEISLLKDYRSSLITEVVTGNRKVI